MHELDPLFHRHSIPSRLLAEPGPDPGQLARMLACAVHVPDHGKLQPWRFLLVRGDARASLGDLLARRSIERHPGAAAASVDKDRMRFQHAPLVIAVIGRLTAGHKIPEQEQLLSGGAACFSLLQAAQALGFGAQWLTGWPAYDPVVLAHLGLAPNERVLGFIHVGSPQAPGEERERPDPASLTTELAP
jgi:nitroreductase